MHEALREALVNTLIHADYTSNCSILIVKRPDLFGFRNPGILRVPLKEAIRGGTSDCRNRNLQKMFQLIGLGEQSGFGFPKIYKNWAGQHWRKPEIEERIESDQTILALRMVSLMPGASIQNLQKRFGKQFDALSEPERIALVTAHAEGCINHARLTELTKEHPSDLTNILHGLVAKKFLDNEGKGMGTFYFLPGAHPIESTGAKEVFGLNVIDYQSEVKRPSSGHKGLSSGYKEGNSGHSEALQGHLDNLRSIAQPVASAQRAPKNLVESTILKLCNGRYLSLSELAELLDRDPDTLRKNFIRVMLGEQQLIPEHPNIKTHPKQRYIAAELKTKESI